MTNFLELYAFMIRTGLCGNELTETLKENRFLVSNLEKNYPKNIFLTIQILASEKLVILKVDNQ